MVTTSSPFNETRIQLLISKSYKLSSCYMLVASSNMFFFVIWRDVNSFMTMIKLHNFLDVIRMKVDGNEVRMSSRLRSI